MPYSAAIAANASETEPAGYRAGRLFFEEKIQPAIDRLRDAVEEYEQLRDEVSEKTGAATMEYFPARGGLQIRKSDRRGESKQ
jgi:hypothetical protein